MPPSLGATGVIVPRDSAEILRVFTAVMYLATPMEKFLTRINIRHAAVSVKS
jgi:hypothetical protein